MPAFLLAVFVVAPLIGLRPRPVRCSGTCARRRRSPSSSRRSACWSPSPRSCSSGSATAPTFGAAGDLARTTVRRIYRFGDYALDGNQVATLIVTVDRGARAHAAVPLHRARPADAGGGREPAHDRARRHQRRPGRARSRGCSRASSPAWPACCSRPCSRRSTSVELHDPARRRHRRRRVRPAHEHPADLRSAACCSASLQGVLAGYLPPDSVARPGPAAVAAVRRAVPAAAVLARAAPATEVTDPLVGRRPAAARPGRGRRARRCLTHRHARPRPVVIVVGPRSSPCSWSSDFWLHRAPRR